MIQILVIEDEKRVADLLKIGLEENGYQVTSSSCHPKIFIKYTTKRCEVCCGIKVNLTNTIGELLNN